jgi:hypothetical protein
VLSLLDNTSLALDLRMAYCCLGISENLEDLSKKVMMDDKIIVCTPFLMSPIFFA